MLVDWRIRLNTSKLVEILAPMVINSYGDNTVKDLVKSYKQMDGVNNISDLLETVDKITALYTHITNFDEIMIKYTTLLNTIVPKRWHDRFRSHVAAWILSEAEWDIDNDEEGIKKCLAELDKVVGKNQNGFICILNKSGEQLIKNSGFDNSEKLKKASESYENISDEAMEELIKKIPIKLQNVKLYHGTSFENYLKIKEDGCIKATNYSDGNYANDNEALAYMDESGYVFTSDSLDFPLSFCFGGYRDNSISWAYEESRKKERKNTDIGVVFEIDPTGYEVLYYPNKGESEFLIKGNVKLKDTKVTVYKIDYDEGIRQITEEEANKIVKESK